MAATGEQPAAEGRPSRRRRGWLWGRQALGRRLFDGTARPPAAIWLPALLVAAALAASPVYLVGRTLGAGPEAAELILRPRTLWLAARTLALMGAVMVGCLVIAAPLAWLTVRTDLPGRGFWRVATMLPLALPSYIVGFAVTAGLGPRGICRAGWKRPSGLNACPASTDSPAPPLR